MTQYVSTDYPSLARLGFFTGIALFALGALGEIVGQVVLGGIPGWEQALFFDMEVLGILLGLFSPLVFGIILPLVE